MRNPWRWRNRAATYHRVSTGQQHQGLARRELVEAARRRKLQVVARIEETASSYAERPGQEKLLELVRHNRVDVVLVWKLDRLGRSLIEHVHLVEELRRHGVRLVAVTQGLEIGPESDAASRYLFNTLAAAAEFERELIRERTLLGLEAARARGKKLGRPVEGPPAEKVLELREQGRSWREVAEELGCHVMAARRAAERSCDA